jgi:hypothetical protein
MFRPLVDVRARVYDMQHDPQFANALSYLSEAGEVCAVPLKLPRTRDDWHAKRAAVEAVLNEIGGVRTGPAPPRICRPPRFGGLFAPTTFGARLVYCLQRSAR